MILPFQRHVRDLTAVHAEQTVRICRGIEILHQRLPLTRHVGDGDILHFVYTIMFQSACSGIIGDQIVVFIIPPQMPRADTVPCTVVAELLLLVHIPAEIPELYLHTSIDGRVQLVHVVVNALVHGFYAACYEDLSVELYGIVGTDQRLEFFYQRAGFFLSDESGGLDGIHKQLQFRELEHPRNKVVIVHFSHTGRDDIHPEPAQLFQVEIERLAIRTDVVASESGSDLRHSESMVLIRFFRKDLSQIEQFQFLIVSLCHSNDLLYVSFAMSGLCII